MPGSAWSRSQLGVSMMWASASWTTSPVWLYGTPGKASCRPLGAARARGRLIPPQPALVAQLERASDYGSEGWGFESLRARCRSPGQRPNGGADPAEGCRLLPDLLPD